jgi:hypothetical protein
VSSADERVKAIMVLAKDCSHRYASDVNWRALEGAVRSLVADAHEANKFITGTTAPTLNWILKMFDDGKPVAEIRAEVKALSDRAAKAV